MFGIGMPELLVIFVIALLVFGPKELPKIGRTIGRAMAEFRRASDDLRDGIQREIDAVEREAAEPAPEPPQAEQTVAASPPDATPAEPAAPAASDAGPPEEASPSAPATEEPPRSEGPVDPSRASGPHGPSGEARDVPPGPPHASATATADRPAGTPNV